MGAGYAQLTFDFSDERLVVVCGASSSTVKPGMANVRPASEAGSAGGGWAKCPHAASKQS
jgi:hypothetical protein